MKLDEFCRTLNGKLAESKQPQKTLELSALALQQAFKVKADEVALLLLDHNNESIRFIWPEKLGSAGNIPLSSRGSLAAATIRENKSQVDNRFTSKQHAIIFEQVKLDKQKDKAKTPLLPIQKIMSVPMTRDEAAIGAVQVCRKGSDGSSAGADFTQLELDALSAISAVIALHL